MNINFYGTYGKSCKIIIENVQDIDNCADFKKAIKNAILEKNPGFFSDTGWREPDIHCHFKEKHFKHMNNMYIAVDNAIVDEHFPEHYSFDEKLLEIFNTYRMLLLNDEDIFIYTTHRGHGCTVCQTSRFKMFEKRKLLLHRGHLIDIIYSGYQCPVCKTEMYDEFELEEKISKAKKFIDQQKKFN